MSNTSKVLISALAGAAAGVIAGILMAPTSGRETRDNLKGSFNDAKEEFNELVGAVADKIKETMGKGEKVASDMMEREKNMVHKAGKMAENSVDTAKNKATV